MTEQRYARTLGGWIRENREALGITQTAVAHAMGVKRATVSAWENGTRELSAYAHARLTQWFKLQREAAAAGNSDEKTSGPVRRAGVRDT